MAFMDRVLLEVSGSSFREVQILEDINHNGYQLVSVVNHTWQTLTISVALDNVAVWLHEGWH